MSNSLDFSAPDSNADNLTCASGVCEIKFSDNWNPSARRKAKLVQEISLDKLHVLMDQITAHP